MILEYLTIQNATAALTIALAAERLLAYIAPRTGTDIDDKALAEIERAKAWAVNAAPHIYSIVELLATEGKINKAEKLKCFLAELAAAWRRANDNKALPDAAAEEAHTIAKGMAAGDKLGNAPSVMFLPPQQITDQVITEINKKAKAIVETSAGV